MYVFFRTPDWDSLQHLWFGLIAINVQYLATAQIWESEDVTNKSFSGHLLISSFLDLPFPAPSLMGYHPQTSAWGSRKEQRKRLRAVYYEEEVDFDWCGRFVSLKRNQLTMNSFCGTSFCYIMNICEQADLLKNNSH